MMKILMFIFILSMLMCAAGNKKDWKVKFEEETDENYPTIYCTIQPTSRLIFKRFGNRIRLDYITVDEELQGQGLGAALMRKLFKIVEKENIREVDLIVNRGRDNEAAVALYKKFGFKWVSPNLNTMTWLRRRSKKEWNVTFEEGTDDNPPTIYCTAHPSSKLIFNRYGNRIQIVDIDVDEELQLQGLGTALMEKLFKIVEKENIEEVDLAVEGGRENNGGAALSENFGFVWDSPHLNSMTWVRHRH